MALYEEFEPEPNRLIDAQSAYLRSAAYQPIGWYEFSPEAFAEAKRQDKPILLDIGAVWCHWCHVIDRESYENPEIATYINERFIPVKVDRDERPDIDNRYQVAVQLLTGQGGWPLTVFLTAEGEPFYGGTYFPPEDRGGRVGLKSLLPKLADAYQHRRHELDEVAKKLSERAMEANTDSVAQRTLSDHLYQQITRSIRTRFQRDTGGFEHNGPKFPHSSAVEVALWQYQLTGDAYWRHIFEKTLTEMARGGIYDQLHGGFHRYSVDAHWHVPHFEKMGYDNASLLTNYVHAFRATGNDFFREIAEGTLNFILGTLADTMRGGFFSTQDADVDWSDDGRFWTWSYDEILKALSPDEVPVMTRYYDIRREGVMPETQRNVLRLHQTPEQIARELGLPVEEVLQRIDSGKERLRELRKKQKHPRIDTNKYTNWNALLISACLEAGVLLGRNDARDFALRSAEVLLNDAYDPDHGLCHGFHGEHGAWLTGLFEDQAYGAVAFLDAYSASGDTRFLETARQLLDLCLTEYWDRDKGGFCDIAPHRQEAADIEFLQAPRKVIQDLPTPAANAMAAIALDRLWLLTHDEPYHDYARQTLETFAGDTADFGPSAGIYALAVFQHLHPVLQVTIVGEADHPKTASLQLAALQPYRLGRQVAISQPGSASSLYPAAPDSQPIAYVCAGENCAEPTADEETLRVLVESFGKPEVSSPPGG